MKRKIIKSVTVLIAGVLVVLALMFFLVGGGDVVELNFPSYQDVAKAKAIEHGMIPDFLPKSATNIRAVRNIDVDVLVVEFSYGEDFGTFLGTQKREPGRSAESLGVVEDRETIFSNSNELAYFSQISSINAEQGVLLVNPSKRRALFVNKKLRPE